MSIQLRSIFKGVLWAAACLLGSLNSSPSLAAETKPNIIIIFSDDMGFGDLSCNGGNLVPTPNIDQLAKEGTRCTQFYVASPICSPSRAGLLTGTYPSRWKLKTFLQARAGNRAAGQVDFLDPSAPTLPRILKTGGYATAHIGKWHLGGGRDVTDAPGFANYGYDEYSSTYESPAPDPNITAKNWIWSPEDKVKRWDRSAYFVDRTLDFLSRKKDQPCFVNLWPDDIHNPWVPKESGGKGEHKSKEELAKVLAEYDRQIGRLMAGLKKLNIDDKTIVIFASDNGPGPDFPGNPRSLGMRGQKGTLYEGGISVPFIVRWPGKIPAGRVDEKSLFGAIDLLPTLCKISGVALPEKHPFDGEDVSPIFFGTNVIRKTPLFWEFGQAKTETNERPRRDRSPNYAVREGKWKLLVNGDGSSAELYHLEADRKETKNVAATNETVTKRMTALAMRWKRTLPKAP